MEMEIINPFLLHLFNIYLFNYIVLEKKLIYNIKLLYILSYFDLSQDHSHIGVKTRLIRVAPSMTVVVIALPRLRRVDLVIERLA
jgi:hypothetical protein